MKNAHRISWHTPINSVSSCFFVGFSEYTDGCRTILSSTELQYYIARQYTKHMPKHKAGPGTGFYDPNRPPQREQFAISNSVSGIPFRHNRTFACFCARLFVSFGFALDTSARQCSNKFDIALAYSYFGFAEDTPARQNANEFAFALAYSYLWTCIRRRFR